MVCGSFSSDLPSLYSLYCTSLLIHGKALGKRARRGCNHNNEYNETNICSVVNHPHSVGHLLQSCSHPYQYELAAPQVPE